ncbi:TonB-dependent receptor [Vaginella massiliensis]|uniref:TonB-dependent receptor n=1 Tax=Vaginella massiliensis TaxID=1816680 RepID=UPI0008384062|nr:TonB-dependent receptor [Vaginella massiliensis]
MKITKISLFVLTFFFSQMNWAQDVFRGQVVDEHNNPISHLNFLINQQTVSTDEQGYFEVPHQEAHRYEIIIDEYGYELFTQRVDANHQKQFKIVLKNQLYELDEVEINAHLHDFYTANTTQVNQEYINQNYAGSLAKSLENLPGVSAMGIGSASSKPIIRGLGFNRLVVAENGVKQEGQQWGVDHGLEIDPLNVEQVEVVKGAGALQYGNEAIAGVIVLKNNKIPTKNTSHTQINTLYQSVNDNYLAGVSHFTRWNNFFYKLKASYSDYADYRTTSDRFKYLDRVFRIEDKRVKNTAGQDLNTAVQLGYTDQRFSTILNVSNFYQKAGFFAGAHGIPLASNLLSDGDYRNIDLPYQKVNHLKVISENEYKFSADQILKFSASYQNNLRQEWSVFHTHYPEQPIPEYNPNLEMEFNLSTYDAQLSFDWRHNEKFKTIIGIQAQNQLNTIDGYNFLLPKYQRNLYGAYLIEEIRAHKNLKLSAGIRYDFGKIKTEGFYDNYLYQYLIKNGYDASTAATYALRSEEISKEYQTINGVIGASLHAGRYWDFALNIGTNYRLPTAIELGANGIHHGSFRHEQGNSDLDPERGFSTDLKINFHPRTWNISVSPYVYYFSNYIFLKPSGTFSILPHSGQIYQYTQSEALISGVEIEVEKTMAERLKLSAVYEYIFNKQLGIDKSKRYPLPFTPANNIFGEVKYQLTNEEKKIENWHIFVNAKYAFEQNRTAQNEELTAAYFLLGAGTKTNIHLNNFEAIIGIQANNILNKKYFNHTSFYRLIELPEQGRNIQVSVSIPF